MNIEHDRKQIILMIHATPVMRAKLPLPPRSLFTLLWSAKCELYECARDLFGRRKMALAHPYEPPPGFIEEINFSEMIIKEVSDRFSSSLTVRIDIYHSDCW